MATSKRIIKKTSRSFKKQNGGLVEYGVGGAIGSIPTPWTAAIGAGVSIIEDMLQQKEVEKQRVTQESANILSANQNLLGNKGGMATFAMGGVIPGMIPNVEVEGGEVIQGKDKSVAKVIGPKHSHGGVPLMMENGGRVFSDKIINPKTGRTFAEDADRFRKMIS